MGDDIKRVAKNLSEFARYLNGKGVSLKFSVTEFKRISSDGVESAFVWEIDGAAWMETVKCVELLDKLTKNTSGDGGPESSIQGLGLILHSPKLKWAPSAYKFAVLALARFIIEFFFGSIWFIIVGLALCLAVF